MVFGGKQECQCIYIINYCLVSAANKYLGYIYFFNLSKLGTIKFWGENLGPRRKPVHFGTLLYGLQTDSLGQYYGNFEDVLSHFFLKYGNKYNCSLICSDCSPFGCLVKYKETVTKYYQF